MERQAISAEIQSMSSVAVLAAVAFSVPYLKLHIVRETAKGTLPGREIWFYWAVIAAVYLAAQFLAQKAFVLYVRKKVVKASFL